MDKYDFALRTASAIFHLGWNSLSLSEEISLQDNSEFRERVEEYVTRMSNGESAADIESKRSRSIKHIILDKPSWEYFSLVSTLHSQYSHIDIDFLCGSVPRTSHFILCLLEWGVTYHCLNIPVNEWKEWKKRTDYQGE
jgi:hypothetical protein